MFWKYQAIIKVYLDPNVFLLFIIIYFFLNRAKEWLQFLLGFFFFCQLESMNLPSRNSDCKSSLSFVLLFYVVVKLMWTIKTATSKLMHWNILCNNCLVYCFEKKKKDVNHLDLDHKSSCIYVCLQFWWVKTHEELT